MPNSTTQDQEMEVTADSPELENGGLLNGFLIALDKRR